MDGAHLDNRVARTAYKESDRQALCRAVAALVAGMAERASVLDESLAFPVDDIAALHASGAMLAPFPESVGGLGLGTEPFGTEALSFVLRLLGQGNLAVGRLFEGHVNAVRLLARLGRPDQLERAAMDAASGHLIGLWVTDGGSASLEAAEDGALRGGKAFCSGAGHAGRAIVSILGPDGASRLAYLATARADVRPLDGRMQGMRGARTARVSFDGCRVQPEDWVGGPGQYLQEPDFSAGAWRTCAVTCGGLEALIDHAMAQLARRGRATDPHQLARMGHAWIARETASMWLARAAEAAEEPGYGSTEDRTATVNFARIAIERACLEAMTLVERSLGLSAFLHPDPIERIRRDLATYLRQPAPDEALAEAAAFVLRGRG